METPDVISAWTSHDATEPVRNIPIQIALAFSQRPGPQHDKTLVIDQGKLQDLQKLLKFLDGEPYAFFTAVIQEQHERRQEDDV